MRHVSLFVFCYLAFAAQVLAYEPPVKKVRFEALTINDGLSQGMIIAMMQDRYGFMWFGTMDGLNRYDGYSFKIFRFDPNDSMSLSGNFVNSICEDNEGRLWVGTQDGLNLFDRTTETFTRFAHSKNDPNSLSSNYVIAITRAGPKSIYIALQRTIDKLTFSEGSKNRFTITHSSDTVPFVIAGLTVMPDGMGYLSGAVDSVYQTDLRQFPALRPQLITPGMLGIRDVPGYKSIGDNSFFLGDPVTGNIYLSFFGDIYSRKPDGTVSVTCKDCRSQGYVAFMADEYKMLNSVNSRLLQIDTRTGNYFYMEPLDVNHYHSSRHTTQIVRDKSGTFWFGSGGYGILKYNPLHEKFHHTGNYSIQSIGERDDGTLIINNIPAVRGLFEKERIVMLDSGSASLTTDYGSGFTEFSYPSFRTSETIWFADQQSIYAYDRSSGKISSAVIPVRQRHARTSLVQSLYEDRDKFLWLATTEGLIRFDPTTQNWKTYVHIPGDSNSLSTSSTFSISDGTPGILWIGTDGGGLHRFDKKMEIFKAYTTADGLPNNVIYGILRDERGCLWMSTNKGLSRFDPAAGTITNYEEKDGLQSNEFNRRAFHKTKDGWFFFGGVNGFNYFKPEDIRESAFQPQVHITDLKIRNQSVPFHGKNSFLQKPAYLSSEITLPYSENMLTFEFASMDLSGPAKNRFSYRLDGFDHNWIASGTQHTATYTNLDPGSYTFRVKGTNHDGVWSDKEASFRVTILPPWYLTWWFRAALAITVAGLLYALYRFRLHHALKLERMRNRIAQDLHDEIGSNLSTISIFSKMVMKKEGMAGSPMLDKIHGYANTSMEAMSDIVWMINARNDRFENIIVHMRSHAAELLEARNIALHMQFDEKLDAVRLEMEARKNFYLIFKEALNNIVKYADCKNVWLEMKLQSGVILLKIRDDGKGFDSTSSNGGNGLVNMKKRAEFLKGRLLLDSAVGSGTRVELEFEY